ncbi:MAG: PhoH family protein [Planctomycetota bacterium]
MIHTTLRIESDPVAVLGPADRFAKMIRESLVVKLTTRDRDVIVEGERDRVQAATTVLAVLDRRVGGGRPVETPELLTRLADAAAGLGQGPRPAFSAPGTSAPVTPPVNALSRDGSPIAWRGDLDVYAAGRRLRPRSDNQARYLEAIRGNDLVFAIGPAGTGKTYLAVAAAVQLLKEDRVRKLMLVRPAVEAGERLGFLPGGIEDKVNPYLRPLLDALNDMMDYQTIRRFMETDVVEICPLAFMRGRTLNNAIVILDEAQNTTVNQMQMFLTRLGDGSKMVVTGDVTQIDLPPTEPSGLIDAARRLRRVPGVEFVPLEKQDVVRHPLVQRIVEAYGEHPHRAADAS